MALTLLAANNAQTVLAAGISASATSLTVNSGTGSLFPAPSDGVSFFKLTLIDAATGQLTEIMHVTARTGDTMTIERGQEGTTARAWSANDIAANMMTAGTLNYILANFQPLDATLTALAWLATGANKLPYFSGVDQMATADLTDFARGLLGKADAATAKGHLGVGSAGGRNIGNGFSAGGSEVPDMTFFAGLRGSAGYQYFPNGMLLQWGTVGLRSAPAGTSIGTFPVAFPAAGQQIFVTHDNPFTNVMAFGAANIVDTTQFRVNAIAINADTFTMAQGYNLTLRWFAIGS